MARLDSGGSGGGGSSDPADPNDDPADTEPTSTETTSSPDPNDGEGLESRGRTETRDQPSGGSSDPADPANNTTDEATGGPDDQLESRSGDTASSPPESDQTQQQPEPEPEPDPEPEADTGAAPDSGGRSFRDRIQNARGRVASGVDAVRERFGQPRTGSAPADDEEVNASPEPPEPQFSGQEEQAVDQFLENNPAFEREDIADAEVNDDGSFSVSFTESGRETYLEENFEETARTGEAPEAAGDLQSSDGQDATVVFDQGLEAGDGVVAERAREIEQDILQDNPGLDESDVRITSGEDNRLQAELTDSGVEALIDQQEQRMAEFEEAGAQQPDNAVDPTQRAQENFEEAGAIEADAALQRIDRVTEIGGDATTAPDRELQQAEQTERVRADVVDQLEKQGVDLDRVNVDVERTPDGFESDVTASDEEQFGDYAINIGGKRLEDYLGDASDDIQSAAETAGNRVAVASPIPYFVGSAVGGETGAKKAVDFQSSTVEGGLLLADVPGLARTAKEAAEFGVYGSKKVAKGEGEEFREQTVDASAAAAAAFSEYATNNPANVGGMLFGSLLGSTGAISAASARSGRLGTATRYAIQPGEELATSAATKAVRNTRLSKLTGDISGGKVDIEEVGIAATRRAGRSARAKVDSGLNVGRTAVGRAKSRLPDRSEVLPDRSGNSFFIDQRTGELVQEGTIRPALLDPNAKTETSSGERPDMLQEFEPEGESGSTPGSGAGGNNALSGAVEIDMRKDSGMVETSVLKFESESGTRAITEVEDPYRVEVTPETNSRGIEFTTRGYEADFMGEETGLSESQAAAEQFGLVSDVSVRESQDVDVMERLRFDTGLGVESGLETEVVVEETLSQPTDQRLSTETAIEEVFDLESVTELEVESDSKVESEWLLESEEENNSTSALDFDTVDDVFDTGVVQSLDELDDM